VRGSVEAPNGLGIRPIICAFTNTKPSDPDVIYGVEDLVQRFLDGSIKKCDVCLATREAIPLVASKIGKILGRKRIMPDARFGTVTDDLDPVIASFKKGRMNFRSEKAGVGRAIIHVPFGKVSFDTDALVENFRVLVKEIKSALPEKTNISSIFISPTMGGSVALKDGGY
jgi:large subunit ribosomal protein L1